MRKIESIVGYALVALFIYSFIELLFGIAGDVKASPTYLIPFRVNAIVVLVGLLASGIAGLAFPLWNVGKYLNTMRVSDITQYERQYKTDYYYSMLGFIGLFCWCLAPKFMSGFFLFGALCVGSYLWWIFLSPIRMRGGHARQIMQ